MASDGGDGAGQQVRLELSGTTEIDDRWLDQVGLLVADLSRDVGHVRAERTPEVGSKGLVVAIILALGSAGAFTAMVNILRTWLGRDRARSVTMTWEEGGRKRQVTVQADSIDNTTLRDLALAAARRSSS
jgi:hypothetical protein